jgi:hypothetical protein
MEIENVLLLFPLYEILCHMVNLYFNSILVFATCYIYYYYLNKTRTNVKFKYDTSLSEFFVFVVMGYELSVSYFLGSVPLESLPQPFFFFFFFALVTFLDKVSCFLPKAGFDSDPPTYKPPCPA